MEQIKRFTELINTHYAAHKRPFPWRDVDSPYYVLVSEIMLQQTQTYRVEPKFLAFIQTFPSLQALADAELPAVLAAWQGLGYNRRAKFLHRAAQIIVEAHNGVVPRDPALLEQLPGIGYATACSIAAFAYNEPTVFIETNIRAVFIHELFSERTDISDKEIMPLVEKALEGQDPRQWYYALMDYGVMLKKTVINPSRKSKHHVKQSAFEGSDRQIRGAILRLLLKMQRPIPEQEVIELIQLELGKVGQDSKISRIVHQLGEEDFLVVDCRGNVSLAG